MTYKSHRITVSRFYRINDHEAIRRAKSIIIRDMEISGHLRANLVFKPDLYQIFKNIVRSIIGYGNINLLNYDRQVIGDENNG